MRPTSIASSFSLAVLVLSCAVGVLPAQQPADSEPSLSEQIARIEAQLKEQPNSIDRWFAKAKLCSRRGDLVELRHCHEQMLRLFREQEAEVANWLVAKPQIAAQPPQPAPVPLPPGGGDSPAPPNGSGGNGDQSDVLAGGGKTVPPGRKVSGALPWTDIDWGKTKRLVETSSPGRGSVKEQLLDAGRDYRDGKSESATKIGGVMWNAAVRRSTPPSELVEQIHTLPEGLGEHLAASLDGLLAFLLEQLDSSPGEPAVAEHPAPSAGEPSAEPSSTEAAERVAYVARLLAQLDRHQQAIAALEQSAALRQGMRPVLAAFSHVVQSWVARIDTLDEQQESELASQQQQLLDVLERLHDVAATQLAVEQSTRGLSKSRAAASGAARELLVAWCVEHLRQAQRFVAEKRYGEAAAQNEQAFVCDNGQRGALAEAAFQRGMAGEQHAQVRHLKYLAGTEGEFSAESRAKLMELWAEARVALTPALEKLADGYTLQRAPDLAELLFAFPILAGKEEEELLDAQTAQNAGEVVKSLQGLARSLQVEKPIESQPLGPVGNAPQPGKEFELPLGKVPYRWIAGGGDQEGFWAGVKVVDTKLWTALRKDTGMADDPGGKAGVSYNSALMLCLSLNRDEAKADRLPAGYEYALPTVAEIERMRDQNDRLPFGNAGRILSSDASGQGDEDGLYRWACSVSRRGKSSVFPWRSDADVGVVFVLRRS